MSTYYISYYLGFYSSLSDQNEANYGHLKFTIQNRSSQTLNTILTEDTIWFEFKIVTIY